MTRCVARYRSHAHSAGALEVGGLDSGPQQFEESFAQAYMLQKLIPKSTSPQGNLRRARRKGPIGYNGTFPNLPPKTAPSLSTITTPI